MQIWVDGDACPVAIKQIIFRAAERTATSVTLVANHEVRVPNSRYVRAVQVSSGFDVADNEILARVEVGDLVITQDIPLAADIIAKGAHALNPRGEMYSKDSIRSRLTMRDFMDTLRASGIHTTGPAVRSAKDRQAFANSLDRFLARHG